MLQFLLILSVLGVHIIIEHWNTLKKRYIKKPCSSLTCLPTPKISKIKIEIKVKGNLITWQCPNDTKEKSRGPKAEGKRTKYKNTTNSTFQFEEQGVSYFWIFS